jgi:FlaA1/EpsC-like NDP-sugar epimerase
MKKTITIFGCGAAGQSAWGSLKSKYRIAAFLDNNPAKHGRRLFGVAICDPAKYDYSRVDHVFIASMYLDEILVQLLGLGVPCSKIEYVTSAVASKAARKTNFPFLRRVVYMPFRLLWVNR